MKSTFLAVLVVCLMLGAYAVGQDSKPARLTDAEFKSITLRDRPDGSSVVIDKGGITMLDHKDRKIISLSSEHRQFIIFDESGKDVAVSINANRNGVSIDVKSPKGSGLACRVMDFAVTLRGQKLGSKAETLLPK